MMSLRVFSGNIFTQQPGLERTDRSATTGGTGSAQPENYRLLAAGLLNDIDSGVLTVKAKFIGPSVGLEPRNAQVLTSRFFGHAGLIRPGRCRVLVQVAGHDDCRFR